MYKQDMRDNILYSESWDGSFYNGYNILTHLCHTLPYLLNNKYCHYVKDEQYLNLNVYLKE